MIIPMKTNKKKRKTTDVSKCDENIIKIAIAFFRLTVIAKQIRNTNEIENESDLN